VISQVNTAFASDGWRINVQKDVFLDNIIEIQNLQNGGQSHTCFSVSVAEDSRATILERQLGDDQESFLSSVSDIDLAEGAEVLWIIIRERGILSTELNRFYARLDKGARLKLVIINAGLHLLRQEVHIDLNGSRSDFQLRCINLLSGESHADTTMKIRHFARSTTSKEMIRNIATDTSCGVFQGMVQVLPTGQKTDAKMLCQSLILSKDAECHAKPELDIFADDILCGHGATFSTIDRNQLFYLMTRGLTFVQAKAVLVKCFIKEQIEGIGQEDIEKALHGVLDHWLFLHL
jgi:Fe-S cluster assembly protein SufD